MKLRTLLVLLAFSTAIGCERSKTAVGPTPTPTPSADPAAAETRAGIEGVVLDGDREVPVPNAVVFPREFCAPGACRAVASLPVKTMTDESGVFRIEVQLPANWTVLLLDVTRDGYELTRVSVARANATSAVLTLLPQVTIRSGESIQTRVFKGTYSCGFESWICRRILVDSPSAASMDIEVIPAEGQEVGLVVGPEASHAFSPSPQRRVTVSGGEVWLYGAPGRVTLTAHRR